jgi:hypothetical protein
MLVAPLNPARPGFWTGGREAGYPKAVGPVWPDWGSCQSGPTGMLQGMHSAGSIRFGRRSGPVRSDSIRFGRRSGFDLVRLTWSGTMVVARPFV